MFSAFVLKTSAESLYMTQWLRKLSDAIELKLPQKLEPDHDYDSIFNYKGKTIRVRTNCFGDVSHVGYKLFDSGFAKEFYARPLLDFMERYALEMDVEINGVDRAEIESRRNVKFVEGDVSLLKKLTPEVQVFINENERRRFSVEWNIGGEKVRMIIPANYQTLIGANAAELEQILLRDVKRIPKSLVSEDLPRNWINGNISSSGDMMIVDYGSYFSDLIRSEIYLKKKGEKACLMIDPTRPLQSVKNILLTGYSDRIIMMDLILDMYGYKRSNLKISLQQMIEYFQNEGCKLYLGIKSYKDKTVEATVFAVNTSMAYNHTVSVVFPLSLLEGGEECLKGTLYAYTPLQNITEKFFNY